MATATIRSTYALDIETARALDQVARRWKVSKSEALRRAIRSAAGQLAERRSSLDALNELQSSMELSRERASAWARDARDERRASSRRAESRR